MHREKTENKIFLLVKRVSSVCSVVTNLLKFKPSPKIYGLLVKEVYLAVEEDIWVDKVINSCQESNLLVC